MKTIHFFQNLFVAITSLTAMFIIAMSFEACQSHHNGGTCTYEGLECPNANKVWVEDSVQFVADDTEFKHLDSTITSLNDSIVSLNLQIAACDFKDHSQIPQHQVVGAGQIHLQYVDHDFPTLVYREHDGNEYFLDYVIDPKK